MSTVGHPDKGDGRGTRYRHALAALALLTGVTTAPVQGAETTDPVAPDLSAALAASAEAWTDAPLGFARALFIEGDAGGFGQYTPRDTARAFGPDDTLTVYVQPLGYGFVESAEGFGIRLIADYELLNPSGQVLAAQTGFAELSYDSRDERREFHALLRFRFDGLRAGDYELAVRLHDVASDKQGDIRLPFRIRDNATGSGTDSTQ
ncbi:hypothetical protein [Stappia stellulata]|uniref:hypothetical protein n=1 Tax=Stappia stellulata TaxID=71235 RepID=UPI0004293A05|nr:hypothetical protein [Stappia stellulata]